ncbi:PaaX family transcriptional regulator C-terminal domain-containing protein [Streptomyces sp. MJP52]|uniref:PaaX family transcriptional regulator n=1 Tax=Streptomyces sp. MJP52 TaxID=2940555 RepID=UPI002474FE51|nr:PaaX family transcriptional regulator C-terminal domain-containing protein [Streptomyces sp. MJP52]MDH6224512.1 phenylacetic acid degradation operon negative regulatory protein [Streptomyces sp. MJP52]
MVRPFDVNEIYPDDPADSVRLPRRRAGGSPQSLAVTLLADYTLRTRASLPSAAIVALLGEFGVTPAAGRTAISRLARRGVLESSRKGRHSAYRLSDPAAVNLSLSGHSIVAFTEQAEKWDGSWTIIAFSLPEGSGAERRTLRGRLRWLGYAPLYDGLWLSPRPFTPRAREELAGVGSGSLTVFRAQHVELERTVRRDPLDAWDVAAIAEEYASFIDRWSPLLDRMRAGEVGGVEAVCARTEVMDTYRRFHVLDPRLPMRCMPRGWRRARVRDVFTAVYDGLAATAQEHVRAVAASPSGAAPSTAHTGIGAHTTADLLAGVRLGEG